MSNAESNSPFLEFLLGKKKKLVLVVNIDITLGSLLKDLK